MSPGENCWDNVALTINDSTGAFIIHLRDRHSGLGLYFQLSIAYDDEHTGNLMVTIDNKDYDWKESTWKAVHKIIDKWYEEYLIIVEKVGE